MKVLSYFPDVSREVKGWPAAHGSDVYLIYRYSYPHSETPDVDLPFDMETLYGALYDAYQCNDGVEEGDVLKSPWGDLVCTGDCFDPWHKLIDGVAVPFEDSDFKMKGGE